MKRIVLLLSLLSVCVAGVFAAPYYLKAQEAARRHAAYARMLANNTPLVLDASARAILADADRVETFRLVDFHEEERYTAEEQAMVSRPQGQFLDDHTVLRVGPSQNKVFAAALGAALAQTPSPVGKDGLMSGTPSCFDPGVGFRVWAGKSHTDLCVCFYCTAIQIVTTEAPHKPPVETMANLGASRSAFLALSKQAFPQDKRLSLLE